MKLKLALLSSVCVACMAANAWASTCSTGSAPNYSASAGGFAVLDGQFYATDGTVFKPQGIGVMFGSWAPSAAQILAQYPGTNFVRLAIYNYESAAQLAPYINDLTSHGIFVEIEDHSNSTGGNAGGGVGDIFTGARLQQELSWYSSVASTFKNNPYVGFGTDNEPSETNPATGQSDPTALSNWQMQTYQAIRNAGNNNPVWLETIGWTNNGQLVVNQGFAASDYAGMTNVLWDMHIYPWLFPTNATQGQANSILQQFVQGAQQITSADGTIPVQFLEFGDSTTGSDYDPNWQVSVQSVLSASNGYAAWMWGAGNAYDNLNNGSAYAAMVQKAIATSGASSCPVSPIPNAVVYNQSTDANGNVSITATTQPLPSVKDVEQQALANVGALTSQVSGEPVLVHSESSPGGTMPTPAPAETSTVVKLVDDGATFVVQGNGTGVISGNQDTVQATAGAQDLTITGSGDAVTMGAYNDTITITGYGNTVDVGGGSDTVFFDEVAQDASQRQGVASTGNVVILPAAGTGTVTIRGTMQPGDKLDLTKALAGTTWDHTAATLWQYVAAEDTPAGCTISVGGTLIAVLPDGAPGGQLGSFVVAH